MKKKIDITVFGCEPDEAAVFHKLSREFGVTVSLIGECLCLWAVTLILWMNGPIILQAV